MSRSKAGRRGLTVRLKKNHGRTESSRLWLERQLNDPFVAQSKVDGYRSRAVYKLAEMDEAFGLIRPGDTIIDLGAAPGGWTQWAVGRVGRKGLVVAIDLQEIEPIEGAVILHGDATEAPMQEALVEALGDRAVRMVMSDMAAPSSGHSMTDHLRIMGLCEMAWDFARPRLAPDGIFLAKVLQGGTEAVLLRSLRQHFTKVRHVKPKASRKDSTEIYVLATGFRRVASAEEG
jgi:23S rRNA (uridine2552-2'-O)-methyltransferase